MAWYYVVLIVAWAVGITSFVIMIRTWEIVREIKADLNAIPEIAEYRIKGEAELWIEQGYIPNTKTGERIAEALSELDDDEAKSLLERVRALKPL
jgi:hypothetical protein